MSKIKHDKGPKNSKTGNSQSPKCPNLMVKAVSCDQQAGSARRKNKTSRQRSAMRKNQTSARRKNKNQRFALVETIGIEPTT
jgi:hypothetical protein